MSQQIYKNFKLLLYDALCNGESEDTFEDQFNLDVLAGTYLDDDEIRIINEEIEELLKFYQEMFAPKTVKHSTQLTQNKYLKKIFMYHLSEQNLVHATFALMLKHPEASNFDNDLHSSNNKNISELLKSDIEKSKINELIPDKKNKNKLTDYLAQEILIKIDEDTKIFEIGRIDNEKIEELKNICLTNFEFKLEELKKNVTGEGSKEEFWKKN